MDWDLDGGPAEASEWLCFPLFLFRLLKVFPGVLLLDCAQAEHAAKSLEQARTQCLHVYRQSEGQG